MKVYKVDKVACLKHLAAEGGVTLSYRSRSEDARRTTALKKQEYRKKLIPDKSSQYGPPDRLDNFSGELSRGANLGKRKRNSAPSSNTIHVDNSVINYFPNIHPEIVGKKARMKFDDGHGGDKWYEGVVSSYNVITGKYALFFPCDGTTEETSFDDGDFELMES